MKGNSVAAPTPPGNSTPKKHSEMKGDVEICPDTAVSEQTRHDTRTHFSFILYVYVSMLSIYVCRNQTNIFYISPNSGVYSCRASGATLGGSDEIES